MSPQLGTSMGIEQSIAWDHSPFMQIIYCVFLPVVIFTLGLFITRKLISPHIHREYHDVTGPFFSTIGGVYGIFLALVVTSTWQSYNTTETNIVLEARYIGDLYANTRAFPPDFRDHVTTLLQQYRDALINSEWKTMQRGEGSPQAEQLLSEITGAYATFKSTDNSEHTYLADSLLYLHRIRELRTSRIDDALSGLPTFLWIILLLGATITISFSFLFGVPKLFSQALMTMLLTSLIFLTLYTIMCLDFPFNGFVSLDSNALQELKLN